MPLYEYQCERCGNIFEVRQKFADAPLTQHEECGGTVHRVLSAPALQFKGSGWYITDYARGGSSNSAASAAKSDGDSGKKTETKPSDSSNSEKPTSSGAKTSDSK